RALDERADRLARSAEDAQVRGAALVGDSAEPAAAAASCARRGSPGGGPGGARPTGAPERPAQPPPRRDARDPRGARPCRGGRARIGLDLLPWRKTVPGLIS